MEGQQQTYVLVGGRESVLGVDGRHLGRMCDELTFARQREKKMAMRRKQKGKKRKSGGMRDLSVDGTKFFLP